MMNQVAGRVEKPSVNRKTGVSNDADTTTSVPVLLNLTCGAGKMRKARGLLSPARDDEQAADDEPQQMNITPPDQINTDPAIHLLLPQTLHAHHRWRHQLRFSLSHIV